MEKLSGFADELASIILEKRGSGITTRIVEGYASQLRKNPKSTLGLTVGGGALTALTIRRALGDWALGRQLRQQRG